MRGEVPGGGTPGRRQEYFLGSALKANVARSVKNSSSHSFVSLLSRARRGGVRDHAGYSSRRWKSLVTEPQIRTLSAISRSSPPLGSASLLMHHAVLTRLPPWPRTKARRPHDCPKPCVLCFCVPVQSLRALMSSIMRWRSGLMESVLIGNSCLG